MESRIRDPEFIEGIVEGWEGEAPMLKTREP